MSGVYGTFFRALAITMSVALFTSLLLALTWTPTLSQYLVRRKRSDETRSPAAGAVEEEPTSGLFGRAVNLYARVMQSVVKRPILLIAGSLVIVLLSYVSYRLLETELLPAMDEGGFILDYFTPPGSSLVESNRILQHIEEILRATPEVETTSRRTGLQLGLAAVTESNRGDFTVKLKAGPGRSVDDVISDLREQIATEEPATKVEFVQLLSDMIGDLTSQPQPVVINSLPKMADS